MHYQPDQMSVSDLVKSLWSGRWVILVTTVLFAGAAVVAVVTLPKRFTAVAVVMPADAGGQGGYGGLGALAARYGGLASLAGISLPTDNSGAEAMATLQSDGLTISYIRDNDLLPVLFEDSWDPTGGRWKQREQPTLWQASSLFKEARTVSQDAKSGMIYVSATWKDPETASKWANGLVSSTNAQLRQRTIQQAERNIEYLRREVQNTNIVELRTAIYSLMESEIQKGMLARGNDEFALRVVDAAIAPEKPSSPKASVLIPAAIIGGFFLSVLLVIIRSALRNA